MIDGQVQAGEAKGGADAAAGRAPALAIGRTRSAEASSVFLAMLLVCLAVASAHWPVLSVQALAFDDHEYLAENPLVTRPGWDSAGRFLREVLRPSTVPGYYQPLSMISLMLDFRAGGRPGNLHAFHSTSLILHLANAALVTWLMYALFGRVWLAAAAGLLFGLHPTTVEAVAWVGQRKTVLAALFSLMCLAVYVRYARRGGRGLYVACVCLYLLALLSKPMSVPLAILLLVLDWWPLGRLGRRAAIEKAPFFLLAAASSAVTYLSQKNTAGVEVAAITDFGDRLLVFCHNLAFYPLKLLAPVPVSAHYPVPEDLAICHPMVLSGVVGGILAAAAIVISLRRTRAIAAGSLFFLIAILPTMGLVGFTNVIAADRFVYLPVVGLLLILVFALDRLSGSGRSGRARAVRGCLAILVLAAAAAAEARETRRYLAHWTDTVSLYRHMLEIAPRAAPVHNNLANALREQGDAAGALRHYQTALECDPEYVRSLQNLGSLYESAGRIDEALDHYRQALRIKPDYATVHNKLGIVLQQLGRTDEAIFHFRKALEAAPRFVQAHSNLGISLKAKGQIGEAEDCHRRALALQPDYVEARINLAILMSEQGRLEEAFGEVRRAVESRPDFAPARRTLGLLLRQHGAEEEAVRHLREAERLDRTGI